MKQQSIWIVLTLVALLSACVAPIPVAPMAGSAEIQEAHDHASDHGDAAALPDEMGQVNFDISCTPEAQDEFNHGMAYLHTFWFAPAIESFDRAAELDSTCGMAYWGKAMSLLGIPWSPAPEQAILEGGDVVAQAQDVDAATPREQAYIDAIAALYEDPENRDRRTRTLAYEEAMMQLAQDHPKDSEAQILYALALIITAQPTDKSYANQHRAAEILEPIFAAQPDHPGVAHYLIHSYDYPSLASQGLDAAKRFAAIAPSSPHALHMPAHIFTRLGYWQESINTNKASAEVAKANLMAQFPANTGFVDALHAMDYMMYGYLQVAQDEDARSLLDEINALDQVDAQNLGSAYALAAMPARYVLERGEWNEGSALTLHPTDFAWERFPQAEAALVFGRALSAARAGDVDAAQRDLDRLQELRQTLLDTDQGYWAEQAHIQAVEVAAWVALAEGNTDDALASMREAAELEAATEKHPVTPGPIIPAYELLGEMLLEAGQPQEALAAFEASLAVDPHRFRSVYGAARAAEQSDQLEVARRFYEELVALGANANGNRAELDTAGAFLSQ